MCLTLWEWVFREVDQRVGQRVGCLAIEVVKLLVKLLMKLYQTGPKNLGEMLRFGWTTQNPEERESESRDDGRKIVLVEI
jgi:hypothetical protein